MGCCCCCRCSRMLWGLLRSLASSSCGVSTPFPLGSGNRASGISSMWRWGAAGLLNDPVVLGQLEFKGEERAVSLYHSRSGNQGVPGECVSVVLGLCLRWGQTCSRVFLAKR
jgi:hypothetical protein